MTTRQWLIEALKAHVQLAEKTETPTEKICQIVRKDIDVVETKLAVAKRLR